MATTLAKRVEALERQVAELSKALEDKPADGKPRDKDWRRTFGMFAGDPVFKQILDEAKRIREEDRARGAT